MKKQNLIICYLLLCTTICNAQIEVARISVRDFKAIGYGAFLNFSLPISEANSLTLEGGFQLFTKDDGEDASLIPVLLGYRYSLDQSGSGFYVEPNAGYGFGTSSISKYNENGSAITDADGKYVYENISGPMAGIGVGYLFEPGRIQFNVGLRYERTFGNVAANIFSLRVSHAFSFRKRDD